MNKLFHSTFLLFVTLMPILMTCWSSTTAAAPILNEVMSSNSETIADADGELSDWVELYNPDEAPYDLAGHFLSDDEGDLRRWGFPDVEIPAKGYLLIFASGKDRTDPAGELHANFRVSRNGEFLALVGDNGESILSSVVAPPLDDDQSYIAIVTEGSRSYQVTNDPSPGAENAGNVVLFSVTGRAFTDSVTLELTSPDTGTISYTEDGRKPTLFNKKLYNGPITIESTKIITASVGNGAVRTEVFIKLDPELADRDSNIPLVVVDASKQLIQADFADMAIGVIGRGENGRASLTSEFATHSRGGIRTRGETSNNFPKKPLRFEFWDTNDDDRELPILDLPTNADWILNARYTFDRSLIHNAWIYELSNQIGQYAPRTRFVELYLNEDPDTPVSEDDYQGIYTLTEKISKGVDRIDVETLPIEATEEPEIKGGYIFRHDKTDPNTWDFSGGGVSMQMIYPPEEERTQRGHQRDWLVNHLNDLRDRIRNGSDPETGYPSVIEERAWIDHQLLNLLPLNVDALRLSAYFYKSREGKVIAGPVWDFDRSAGGTSDSRIGEAETWRGAGGDEGTHFFSNQGSGAASGTPVWWHDLFQNPDFHTAWADRWNELRQAEFSDENIAAIINRMGDELAESAERNFAKWPGAPTRSASQLEYSDVDGFEGEIKHMIGWLQARAAWITDQIITVPTISPTETVHEGPVEITMKAGGTLFKPDVIYHTTDGEDPRAPGGDPSATSSRYSGAVTLTESATVMARNKDDGYQPERNGPPQTWSGFAKVRFFIGEEPARTENLVVSEIMYNPADPTEAEEAAGVEDKDQLEFLELLNVGSHPVSLYSVRLRGDADFDFGDDARLEPGARLVLVSDAAAFAARYGASVQTAGEYSGRLTNSGARIFLRAHDGATIHEFSYSDDEPWPQEADGDGRSLVPQNESEIGDPGLPTSWAVGSQDNGTPGTGEDGGEGPVDPQPGESYASWLAEHFTEAERADEDLSGPNADGERDGIPTLAEYLFGGRPKVADDDKVPTVSVEDGFLHLRYVRQKERSDVEAQLQVSTDLISWSDGANVEEVAVTDAGDDSETVLLWHSVPLAESGARFARLQVRQQ